MAVTLTNSQLSAGLYSAFWNRAPDATGQNFWVGNLNAGAPVLTVATAFYNAPEGLAAYPNWIRNDPAALVTQVYTSVFERAPDAGGLAFYVAQLNAGTSFPQVVLNMMYNALNAGNTDGAQFANEIQVGIYVSEVLRTDDPAVTGVALEGVTADPASVTVREAELYAMTHVGNTYTLTTGINDITGTPLNDTFNAPLATVGANTTIVNTLQAADYLDGNGGIDTLNAQLVTGVAVNIDNIEIINATAVGTAGNARAGGTAVTLNLQNSAAVTDVNNNGSTEDLTVSGIAAGASNFGVADNGTKATTFTDTVGVVRTSANLFLENAGGTVTITSPTVNLVSDGTVANSITLTDTALTTLNVAGANAVTVAGLGATTTVVNGAASTGGLTAALATTSVGTIIGGAGNDSLTGGASNDVITGNAGNDTLTAGAGNDLITAGDGTDRVVFATATNLTVADTVIGGAGVDTLAANSADLTAAGVTYTNISGMENVEVLDNLGANLTLSNIQAGITGVVLDGTATARTITFDSGVNGAVTLGVQLAGALTVASAGAGITDSLTINNGAHTGVAATDNVFNGNALTATGVETLTLNLGTATAAAQTIGAIGGISGTTAVVINGNNNVTLTGVATAGSINASGLTGTAAFSNAGKATSGVTNIVGSANADTIVGSATATSIDGGAGNDDITGGAAADYILGGAGNDAINGGAGNDIIHGDAGDDTITVNAGTVNNVTIDGGAGNDTVVINNTLAAGDLIDGGAGVNTFAQSTALIAAYAGVTNFNTLRLDAVMSQNLANFTANSFAEVDVTGAGVNTLSGLADTTAVHVVTGGSLVATHATDTAANTLTVGGYTAGGVTINAVTANDTNTLNVVDGETTLQVNISSLNAAQVNQINLTGAIAKGLVVATSTDAVTGFGTAARTISVDGSANGAAVTFDGHTAAANQVLNVVGSAYNDGITGGLAADIINGGAGNDTIDGGAGNDSITGGVGNDAITGGSDADYLTGGLGVDTYVQAVTNSVLSTAQSTSAGTAIAAGQTITFANGVDVISDFLAGTGGDVIDTVGVGAAITAITVANNALEADKNYFFSGSYNSLTGVFTIAAAGTGPDTMIMSTVTATAASQNWATNQDAIVLIGVDSDNLVAGNFA